MKSISVDDLAALGSDVSIIDVREEAEYLEACVPGTRNIPLSRFPESQQLLPGPDSGSRRTVNRLERARGQLTALIAAVESGAECRNVVTQLSAVRGALDKAGFELISTAMRDCLTEPADVPTAGGVSSDLSVRKPTLEEIHTLFLRLT